VAKDGSESNLKWIVGVVVVPILVACIGAGVFQIKDGCLPFLCGSSSSGGGTPTHDTNTGPFDPAKPADIFLSSTSGPGGSKVNVSGEGFQPNEQIVIRFHTEEIGRTQANSSGQFKNVTVTIPRSFSQFAPQKFDIVATGKSSIKSAQAQYTLSG
jgi:hypothetical protein